MKELMTQGGFDSVLLALGAPTIWSEDDTCSAGTKNILSALKDQPKKPRIILCSSMNVSENAGVNWFVKWMLKHPRADKII